MADVLSQIPGLAGYLAMENQRRQAAMADLKGVSGLASLLQQQREAALQEQMAPLRMQAMQAQVDQQRMAAEDAQRRRAFFTQENFQRFMTPGSPAVAPGQGVTGGMDSGGLGQILGAGATEEGAPAAQPGSAPRLDIDRLIPALVAQGIASPEVMIARQSQIDKNRNDFIIRQQQLLDRRAAEEREARNDAERNAARARYEQGILDLRREMQQSRQGSGGGGGEKWSVVQTDQGMMLTDGKGNFRPAMGPDGKPLRAPKSAAEARAERENERQRGREEGVKSRLNLVLNKVDEALKNTGIFSAGFLGGTMSGVRGSPAYDLEKTVDTIKANIGFQELQAMRDASPTGGALGQVAVKELDMLQATIASLDVGQSPSQLRSNLRKIKTHYENWLKTLDQPAQQNPGAGQPTGGFPSPAEIDAELKRRGK